MAHLDNVNLELAELVRHRLEFIGLPNPSGVGTELVSVHVGDGDEAVGSAGRAGGASAFAVVLRGAQEVRVCVAEITAEGAAVEETVQCGAALEAEVHDRSWARWISDGLSGRGLRSTTCRDMSTGFTPHDAPTDA